MFNSGPCPAAQPNIICNFGSISVGFWWFTRIFLLFDVCWQKICSSLNRKKKRKISENQNSAWKGHTLAFCLSEDPICILFNYWKPHIFFNNWKIMYGSSFCEAVIWNLNICRNTKPISVQSTIFQYTSKDIPAMKEISSNNVLMKWLKLEMQFFFLKYLHSN